MFFLENWKGLGANQVMFPRASPQKTTLTGPISGKEDVNKQLPSDGLGWCLVEWRCQSAPHGAPAAPPRAPRGPRCAHTISISTNAGNWTFMARVFSKRQAKCRRIRSRNAKRAEITLQLPPNTCDLMDCPSAFISGYQGC